MTHRLSQLLVVGTLALLFAGGLVTSTHSGLAVPDWPLSYGSLFPPMVGGIRFEHTHRILASTVGFLTLLLVLWVGKTEKQASIRWLSITALGAVVLQGILGGLTVLHRLPAPISVAHACLAPLFFSLVVSLAELTQPCFVTAPHNLRSEIAPLGLARTATFFFFLQILLGAVIRHTGKGVWPHVVTAFLVLILTGLLVTQVLSNFGGEKRVTRPALLLALVVTSQFFLGIGAFAFTRIETLQSGFGRVFFPTVHQTLGAVILATGVWLNLRLRVCPKELLVS